jgi:hypothetical protein
MGDSGEGLVDAEARFQERLAEREQEQAHRDSKAASTADPERDRALRSLNLAKIELERQVHNTQHPVRLEQIRQALSEIERRIAETIAAPSSK